MNETKRFVLENFPIERLPDEVRPHFSGDDVVDVTVESRNSTPAHPTISEILDSMKDERTLRHDPVERVREFRRSGRRDALHARIRRGKKT